MSEKSETNETPRDAEFTRDPPATNDNPAFRAEEIISCRNCGRGNPPTRPNCLYCGAELAVRPAQSAAIAPILRPLEDWEKGFNVIYLPDETAPDERRQSEIAKQTRRETEFVRQLVEANSPLPLVRAESETEAEIIRNKLREINIETLIIGDAELAADKPPRRLRGIEFFDDQIVLRLFNTDEIIASGAAEIALIVTGAIFNRRTESMEKRKKGKQKILDATEISSDELLIDIYAANDNRGFRIAATGFDFSSLGDKNILAAENIKKLTEKLREFAPAAKFVDDYAQIRHLLGAVWEVEHRQNSLGLKRHSFGKFDFSRVESSSNLAQFTKYSRLQKLLEPKTEN